MAAAIGIAPAAAMAAVEEHRVRKCNLDLNVQQDWLHLLTLNF
jgi:hypothetical protein